MQLYYSENEIKEVLKEAALQYPKLEMNEYQATNPLFGIVLDNNGVTASQYVFMDSLDNGLFLVVLDGFERLKIKDYTIIEYSDIKGYKLINGQFSDYLIIQLKDHRYYKIQIVTKETEQLTNQKTNLDSLIRQLEFKVSNQYDESLVNKVESNTRLQTLSYFISLVIVASAYVYLYEKRIDPQFNNVILFAALLLLTIVLHALIYFFIVTKVLDPDSKFLKKYNIIIKEFNETSDFKKLKDDLLSLEPKPTKQSSINVYNFSLSSAYMNTNEKDKAIECLLQIKSNSVSFNKEVKKQLERLGIH